MENIDISDVSFYNNTRNGNSEWDNHRASDSSNNLLFDDDIWVDLYSADANSDLVNCYANSLLNQCPIEQYERSRSYFAYYNNNNYPDICTTCGDPRCCTTPSRYEILGRPECFHPPSATGAAYMPSTTGGAQSSSQAPLRVQPQQSAQPAPQQDMSKSAISGHNYVTSQNQTPQTRPQYSTFQYRTSQHGSRPNTHPRQQQPFIPGAAQTATAPVMYHPFMFHQPTPMGIPPSYQQPRSNTPGFYQYVAPFISYSTPPSHNPPYYFQNNQQLPTQNIQGNAPGGRSNPTTLVGSQGTPTNATAPAATLSHPQAQTHMHQAMPGPHTTATKRPSRRLAIIDPVTQQDIFSDMYSNDSQYLSGESSERQTPQPEPTHTTHSIAEEFTRMVNEVANQTTNVVNVTCESALNFHTKNVDLPISSTNNALQPQTNSISPINNNIAKSELNVNESKSLGPDVAAEPNETPVVSAISDSPVIVPKMPMNIKQLQKSSEPIIQSVVIDTNKNVPPKQQKQNKSKPVVPQVEEAEKTDSSPAVSQGAPTISTAPSIPVVLPVNTVVTVPVAVSVPITSTTQAPMPILAPQPQRIPRERLRTDDKEKSNKDVQEKENPPASKPNGPMPNLVINSVDDSTEVVNPSSQSKGSTELKTQVVSKKSMPSIETETSETLVQQEIKVEIKEPIVVPAPTATELLSASIEKLAKELPAESETVTDNTETSSAIQAQAKLTQSLASCLRQSESKMKDINLNNKNTDPDSANGNTTEITNTETKEDINKNEKVVKNSKNNKKSAKMANNETNVKETESYENGKDETDKVSNVEEEKALPTKEEVSNKPAPAEKPEAAPVFVPKYKYHDGQWSPLNKSGKKCYDILLLKQIKEDPMSKNKPDAPLLETCNVIRTAPIQEPLPFTPISRPMNDTIFPNFFPKSSGIGSRNNPPREPKKDGRSIVQSGKGSAKLTSSPSSSSAHKPVIHVSLSLREEVKLNETKDAWKPARFKRSSLTEEDFKTQDLYKKFRGILNKLTPQKFDTLMERIKNLEINNQRRLEGVIDLVFEKAIEEPNFSEAYAAMCNKLSVLKVPADNATSPDQCVNFRALIITRCQNQFEADKVDEQVLKLEKELNECTDPVKKKELHIQLNEEQRRVRMRSVGNVRFIGELYKLKMLTAKIMVFCMNYLIDKLEEEKLECLCKLLTTIGEQVESEVREQLDYIIKKMQDIVDSKSNKISSRVRFMIQDVIALRNRKWITKSVVDSQPKMMDQIQKEAEQQQRHIELMNAAPMFRRDDGGRGKRGEGRRQNSNSFMDNNWKTTRTPNYTVDTSKFKAVTQNPKSINNIKLAPQNSGWNHGSGTKNTAQTASNSMLSLTKTNMYSVLENVQTDPTILRGNKDMSPTYHSKGASIERSTFNSRGDFPSGNSNRSGSVGVARSNSGSRGATATPTPPAVTDTPAAAPASAPDVQQEPLPDAKKISVKSMVDLSLINPDDHEVAGEVKHLFQPQYHAAVVTEILNIAFEKTAKDLGVIANTLLHLVSTNTITPENLQTGLTEIFEIAPDLYIDIPKLYEFLAKFTAPHIEKKHITFAQVHRLSKTIISSNHGHLLLKAIIKDLKESMGPSFVKSKWEESGLELKQWMDENQVAKWIEDNKFEFLEGGAKACEETKKILTPSQTQTKLVQLMNSDESCECIKGWIQDNLDKTSNEDWFMRALIQAICDHALFGPEGREVPQFNQDRMYKYHGLINEFGENKQAREASCLFGIQQLIHRLEHPQGLTLEIFQYMHEQYIISVEGFIAWEESEQEPEGKAVMLKALTSFFTSIKEADNEDSCSED